jgi:hypothetical protein
MMSFYEYESIFILYCLVLMSIEIYRAAMKVKKWQVYNFRQVNQWYDQ